MFTDCPGAWAGVNLVTGNDKTENKPLKKTLFVFVLTALIVFSGISACQSSNYKTLSVTEGINPFSFEYSREYSLIRLNLENSSMAAYTSCQLRANDNLSEIYVDVWMPSSLVTSSGIIDGALENAEKTLKNYSLVSRTNFAVGDVTAFQAVFTAEGALNSQEQESSDSTTRPAAFSITSMMISGLVVEIDMTCDKAIADSLSENYRHLIDSFKMTG